MTSTSIEKTKNTLMGILFSYISAYYTQAQEKPSIQIFHDAHKCIVCGVEISISIRYENDEFIFSIDVKDKDKLRSLDAATQSSIFEFCWICQTGIHEIEQTIINNYSKKKVHDNKRPDHSEENVRA